jgi:HlyD family secretion protein
VRAEIDLSCQCPEGLKIGTFVPIKVVLREDTGLTVPRRAIVPLPEQRQGVYVVRSDKLALVSVETDFFNETRALVRGDLKEGEPVVVGEYLQWVRHHQGQPVEVQK